MLQDEDNSKINALVGLLKVQKDASVNVSISQSFASAAILDHLWRGKKKPPCKCRLFFPEREAHNLVVCKYREHGSFLPVQKFKKPFVCVMDFIMTWQNKHQPLRDSLLCCGN